MARHSRNWDLGKGHPHGKSQRLVTEPESQGMKGRDQDPAVHRAQPGGGRESV